MPELTRKRFWTICAAMTEEFAFVENRYYLLGPIYFSHAAELHKSFLMARKDVYKAAKKPDEIGGKLRAEADCRKYLINW